MADAAKLIIEVTGGEGLEETPQEVPHYPGASPEPPRPAPLPEPPRPVAERPVPSGKMTPLGPGERRQRDLDEFLGFSPPERPAPPPKAPDIFMPEKPKAQAEPDTSFYPRYRELQNRQDMGGKLSTAELDELKKHTETLKSIADRLAPGPARPTPAPPGSTSDEDLKRLPRGPLAPGDPGPRPGPRPPGPGPTWTPRPNRGGMPRPPVRNRPKLPTATPVRPKPTTPPKAPPRFPPPPPKPGKTPAPPKPGSGKPLPRAQPVGTAAIKNLIPSKVQQGLQAFGYSVDATSASIAKIAPAAVRFGGVLLALEVGTAIKTRALNTATGAIEGMGKMAARVASNDYLGAFNAGVEGAASTLEKIPIVGKVYAAELRLATAPIRAFTVAANAFVERGQFLARFSSELGAAGARASVRSTLADVRESQALSPGLTRLTDNTSQMETGLRDLLLPIKEGLVDLLAETSEVGKEIMTILKEFAPVVKIIVQMGTAVPVGVLKILAEVIQMFRKALEKWPFNVKFDDDMKEGELNSMLKDFLNAGMRIPGPMPPGQRGAAAAAVAGRIFGGQ